MHEFGFQVSDEADRVGRPTDVEVLLAPSLRNSARRDSFTYDVRGGGDRGYPRNKHCK